MADKKPKDLDFDELHKAVNALMDQAQKGEKPKSAKAGRPDGLEVVSEPKQELAPAPEPPQDNAVKVSVKRPTPAVTRHRASHGRAMDVVARPTRPEGIAPPSVRPNHQAPTLQPTQEVRPEPVAPVVVPERQLVTNNPDDHDNDLNDALASLDMQTPASSVPAVASTMTHQKNDWPDPLEVLDKTLDSEEKQTTTTEPGVEVGATDTAVAVEPAPTLSPQSSEPIDSEKPEPDSPFVTTKVEKRPLGAYSDAQGDEDLLDNKQVPVEPAATPQTADQAQKETPNPLPAQQDPEEFNPAVVAVESADADSNLQAKQDEAETEQPDPRTMSIPPQYQESEKLNDDSPRPVFDTKQYHPAIEAHTGSHKGSSLGAWLLALVLLVLLVGILVATYYFVTGSLDFSTLFQLDLQ